MSTDHKNYYLGIDLGTTNSSVHFGAFVPTSQNLIDPTLLEFDQLKHNGFYERDGMLPSFVYFKPNDSNPIIGEYARFQGMQYHPSRVAREVKNYMGNRDWYIEIDGKKYTAVDISGMILKTLFDGIRNTLGEPVTDVVITVPASFDSDMRRDTIEAAKSAGFKITEDNGEERNILLDEPRASLYDLVNMRMLGRVRDQVISFSEPKTVLVFDLGGGTLDVSLHQVCQNGENPITDLTIDDIAISRYTRIGGGDFDKLIAARLIEQFENLSGERLADMPDYDAESIRFKLEYQAELSKVNLNNDAKRRLDAGDEVISPDLSYEINLPFLYGQSGLYTNLTYGQMEEWVSPLMGWNLSLSDVDKFHNIDYSKANNIVYPILDVLCKAKERTGSTPQIDAVVLTGGMTGFLPVRKRLEELFGMKPICILDPDKSVSRGATVYHYYLHLGMKPSKQILAESIGVEVVGNRIFHLVKAGTVLPFEKEFPELLAVPVDGASRVRLPLYRGERTTPEPPNVKIASPEFVSDTPLSVDDPIDVKISVDEQKIVHFHAYLKGQEIRVEFSESGNVLANTSTKPNGSGNVIRNTRPISRVNIGNGQPLSERDVHLIFRNKTKEQIKDERDRILSASNIDDLIRMLIENLKGYRKDAREEALYIMGVYAASGFNLEMQGEIVQTCLAEIPRTPLGAINALGKIGNPIAESHLIRLLTRSKYEKYYSNILYALGKCGITHNALHRASYHMNDDKPGLRMAACWAIGRIGSRECDEPVEVYYLTPTVKALIQMVEEEGHLDVLRNAVYAIGELCDQRDSIDPDVKVSDDLLADAIGALERRHAKLAEYRAKSISHDIYLLNKQFEISLGMMRGDDLTSDQEKHLATIRTLATINKDR